MNLTDPIADMLTRIRNAAKQKHATVDVPKPIKKSRSLPSKKPVIISTDNGMVIPTPTPNKPRNKIINHKFSKKNGIIPPIMKMINPVNNKPRFEN